MIKLFTMIKNLFKVARLLSTDDSGDFRVYNVSFMGKEQKILGFTPYGLMHHPPEDSMVCVGNQLAQASNGIGVADDPANRIFKNLAEGEVALGNYVTGDYIYFDEDNNIKIQNAKTNANVNLGSDGSIQIENSNTIIAVDTAGKLEATVGGTDGSYLLLNPTGGCKISGGRNKADYIQINSTGAVSIMGASFTFNTKAVLTA